MKIFKTFRFICVTVLLMIGTKVSAYDFVYNGIYYNCTYKNNIINYRGYCTVVSGDEKYAGDITIPKDILYNGKKLLVTSIDRYAFRDCSELTSINIPNSVTEIGEAAFKDCSGLTSINIPKSVKWIVKYTFSGCSGLTSITIPNSVKWIGEYAFSDCSGLTSITIPYSVTEIGNYTFNGCSGLKKLVIEDGLETLELGYGEKTNSLAGGYTYEGLFYTCPLTSLYLGRNLKYISVSPVEYNSTLTEVIVGKSVKYIVWNMFESCSGLTELYSLNPTPPTIDRNYTFSSEQYKNINVFVPQGSLSAYQVADGWEKFKNLQEFDPTGVETIKADMEKVDDTYYDIQGRKLNAPKNGLNIINGKKVLIRK